MSSQRSISTVPKENYSSSSSVLTDFAIESVQIQNYFKIYTYLFRHPAAFPGLEIGPSQTLCIQGNVTQKTRLYAHASSGIRTSYSNIREAQEPRFNLLLVLYKQSRRRIESSSSTGIKY